MKFYFGRDKSPSSSSSPEASAVAGRDKLHKNLFVNECDDGEDESTWLVEDEEEACKQQDEHRVGSSLSMPLSDTIAEYAYDLTDDPFFFDDLSFVFELSRKRAISPYAILVALLYMKRLKQKTTSNNDTPIYIDSYSSRNVIDSYFIKENVNPESLTNSELCLVSMLLASKYLIDEGEDEEIYNNEWAKAANMSTEKINKLEKLVLGKMDWELYVSSDEFWSFTNQLTERITLKKVKLQLDNCTYSDLDVLLTGDTIRLFNSVDSARYLLLLLAKILVLCTSTLVYVALSSYLASSCALYVKNDLALTKHFLSLAVDYWPITSHEPTLSTSETPDLNILFSNSHSVDHFVFKNVSSSYLERLEERICNLNDKIKSFLNRRLNRPLDTGDSSYNTFFNQRRLDYNNHFLRAHTKQFEFNSRLVF